MTQVELDWLVRPPEGVTFNAALTSACRGSSTIATVANFFLFEAAKLAKRNNIDKTSVEYISVVCTLDDIIAGMKRLNRTATKKTLIAYISKLQSWEYVQSDGYRHTYNIYFNNIQVAFNKPPEAEIPRPRGRHAHRVTQSSEDCNFENEVESTISTIFPKNEENRIVIFNEEIVNLQSEIVDLREEIVNLQSEIVKVQSLQSSEAASRLALEAKVDALYKLVYKDNNIDTKEEEKVSPPPPETAIQKSPRSRKPANTEKTKIELSPGAQEAYDEWCKMPWFKVKPDLTPTLADHCEIAKAYEPTADIMLKVKNDATSVKNDKKGFYRGKGWNFKFFLNELPQWLAVHPETVNSQGKTQSSTTGTAMNHDEAIQLAAEVIAQSSAHGISIQAHATSTSTDAWVVSAWWNGNKLQPITSQTYWKKYLIELRMLAEDDAAQNEPKKGVK